MTTFKLDDKLTAAVNGLAATYKQTPAEAVTEAIYKAVPLSAAEGAAKEIPSSTRLTLAYILLVGIAALFGMAGFFLLHAPADKAVQAQLFFDFAKSFGPPIVTLVIGYYFGDKSE